jgi:hypothetical protein
MERISPRVAGKFLQGQENEEARKKKGVPF